MSVPGLPTSADLSKETTSGAPPANAYFQSDHFDNKVPMQLPINNKRIARPPGMQQLPPPSATPPCFGPSVPVSSPGGSPLAPLAPGVTMDWQTLMGNLRGRARCASSSPMSSSLASSPYASTSVPSPTPCLPEPSHQFPSGDFPMDPAAAAAYGYQNGPGFSKWSIYREAALRQEEMARIQWERQVQEGIRQRLHGGFTPGWCGPEQFQTTAAGGPSTQYAKGSNQDTFGAAVAAAAMAIMEGRYDQQQQQMSFGLPSREAYYSSRMMASPSPTCGPGYDLPPPPQQQRSGLPYYIEEMIRNQIEQQIRECVQQQVFRIMEQWRDNTPVNVQQRPPTASSAWDQADQAIFTAAVAAATKAVNAAGLAEGSQLASEQFRGMARVGSPPPPLLAPMPSRATAKREPGTNSFVESVNHQPPNKNDASRPADGVRLAPYVPPADEESTPDPPAVVDNNDSL